MKESINNKETTVSELLHILEKQPLNAVVKLISESNSGERELMRGSFAIVGEISEGYYDIDDNLKPKTGRILHSDYNVINGNIILKL